MNVIFSCCNAKPEPESYRPSARKSDLIILDVGGKPAPNRLIGASKIDWPDAEMHLFHRDGEQIVFEMVHNAKVLLPKHDSQIPEDAPDTLDYKDDKSYAGLNVKDVFPLGVAEIMQHFYVSTLNGNYHHESVLFGGDYYTVRTFPIVNTDKDVISGMFTMIPHEFTNGSAGHRFTIDNKRSVRSNSLLPDLERATQAEPSPEARQKME